MTKYHCKRSEPEKKSLVIKYFPSLPSSSSLLLTDHFSLCHTVSLTSWFTRLASFYFLFSDGRGPAGRGEGEVAQQRRGEAGQARPRAQPLGAEAAPDPGPG